MEVLSTCGEDDQIVFIITEQQYIITSNNQNNNKLHEITLSLALNVLLAKKAKQITKKILKLTTIIAVTKQRQAQHSIGIDLIAQAEMYSLLIDY